MSGRWRRSLRSSQRRPDDSGALLSRLPATSPRARISDEIELRGESRCVSSDLLAFGGALGSQAKESAALDSMPRRRSCDHNWTAC